MFAVPERFRSAPVARPDALAAGISARVLEGVQFEAAFVAHCAEARVIDAIKVGSILLHLGLSGLPEPEVNAELRDDEGNVVIPDLWFADGRQAVEYEGSHHQPDLQVTKERMRRPRLAMLQMHRALVDAGYVGPAPTSGESATCEGEKMWLSHRCEATGKQARLSDRGSTRCGGPC